MRRIWEPCSFVGQQGVCTVCFPTFYIFMYPHLQIAVSVDAPDSKQVDRKRPAQSPGMSAVKQAGYAAKKASRAATIAYIKYMRAKTKELKRFPLVVARQHGIMRSWQKTGNKKAFSHLERWHKAEMEIANNKIPTLDAQVHFLLLVVLARDAALLHRDARIARLSGLLRMRKWPGRRWSACGL